MDTSAGFKVVFEIIFNFYFPSMLVLCLQLQSESEMIRSFEVLWCEETVVLISLSLSPSCQMIRCETSPLLLPVNFTPPPPRAALTFCCCRVYSRRGLLLLFLLLLLLFVALALLVAVKVEEEP